MGSGSCVCFFLSRQVHLGKEHMAFKFIKDFADEQQKINEKYKVRITSNCISCSSLTILNSCCRQDAISGERKLNVKLGGEEADDQLIVTVNQGWL